MLEEQETKKREEIYQELKDAFINKEGEKVWNDIQDIASDTLKDLAKAKFYSYLGTDSDKHLARAAAAMIQDSLKDLAGSVTDKAANYALERLESFISKVVFREIIKLIV